MYKYSNEQYEKQHKQWQQIHEELLAKIKTQRDKIYADACNKAGMPQEIREITELHHPPFKNLIT